MKKLISFTFMLFFVTTFFAVHSIAGNKAEQTKVAKSGNVEVYYFHYTRRCSTCVAVEEQTKKTLGVLFPAAIKSGKLKFSGVNLDDKLSEKLAKRCKAEGQALLVISGAKRIDLTEEGFMYAVSNPEKLKQALRNAINTLQ